MNECFRFTVIIIRSGRYICESMEDGHYKERYKCTTNRGVCKNGLISLNHFDMVAFTEMNQRSSR